MQRLLTQTTKSLLNSVTFAKKLTGNRSKLTFPVFKLLLFQLYFFIAPLATAVADNRIEVFVDGKPVLVPPGSTVLQVYIYGFDWSYINFAITYSWCKYRNGLLGHEPINLGLFALQTGSIFKFLSIFSVNS